MKEGGRGLKINTIEEEKNRGGFGGEIYRRTRLPMIGHYRFSDENVEDICWLVISEVLRLVMLLLLNDASRTPIGLRGTEHSDTPSFTTTCSSTVHGNSIISAWQFISSTCTMRLGNKRFQNLSFVVLDITGHSIPINIRLEAMVSTRKKKQ
jgi:hypothetical protein